MKKDINQFSKSFIALQTRIENKRQELTKLSEGEKSLIKSFEDLKSDLWDVLSKNIGKNNVENFSSLTALFVSYSVKNEYNSIIFKKLIEYRLYYEKVFSYGKNSTFNRNPILQIFITDLLEIYNNSINENKWKEMNVYSEIIGTTRGEEKWEIVSNNTRLLNIDAQNLLFSLSCIDNILFAKELIFDDIPITNNNFFYVCINTWKDIDDLSIGGYIPNYEDELHTLKDYFRRHNIRHFIIFNPTKQNYLLLTSTFKPNYQHYIGHSGRDYLWFRKKSYIAPSDIKLAYSSNTGIFMFLNSCDSSSIALELKNINFDKTIGYTGGLDYNQAVYFAEEFYTLNNPRSFTTNFLNVINQAIINLNRRNLFGYNGQSLIFNNYSPYQR